MKQILFLFILIFSFLACDSKNKTNDLQTVTICNTTLCDSLNQSNYWADSSIEYHLNLFKKAQTNGVACDICLGKILHSIGKLYKGTNKDSALCYFKEAIRCRQMTNPLDSLGLAYSHYNLGTLYLESFKYDSALISFKKASIYAASDTSGFKSDVNKEIGKTLSDIGDYENALAYFKEAIPYTSDKEDLFLTISQTYLEKGDYTNTLKIAKAAQYAFEERLKSPSNQPNTTTLSNLNSTLTNQGIAYRSLNQLDASFYCFNRALKISQQLKDIALIANKHLELANNYLEIKDFNNAKENAERSLQLRKSLPNKQIESLRILGDIAQVQKKPNNALMYYQKALHLLDTTFINTSNSNTNPIVPKGNISHKKALVQILTSKIAPLSNLYVLRGKPAYLDTALQTCLLADTILQKLRREIYTEEAKFFWNENAIPLYEKGIKLAHQLYDLTGNRDYLLQALHFFERTKAPVLREALFEKEAKQTLGISARMLERERFLTQTIIKLERETSDNSNRTALRRALKDLNYLQDSLKKDPTYKRFFEENYADRKPLSMQQLSGKVADNQLIVSYFWGKDSVYIFSWSRQGNDVLPKMNNVPLTPEFKQAVEQFKNTVQDKGSIDDFKKHAYRLFEDLLEKPIQFAEKNDSIKRITIIADGDLHNFPFEALTKKDISAATNFGQANSHFLIRHYAFSQALSVDKISPPSAFSSFFCSKPNLTLFYMTEFSLPFFKEQKRLGILSAPKTVALNSIFSKIDSFKEKEVQKDTFLHALKNASVLYVSTHAIADTTPLTSKIYFNPKNKDSADPTDYYLTSREVYNAETKADLVVLSACQTAKGKIQQGEGALSLARAFIFAGSRSLIVTQWQADDITMNTMVPNFFENWLNHETKDIALQKAKNAYLKDVISLDAYHPYFWAVTSVIGDLDYPKSNLYIWLLAAIFMIVIFYWIRQAVRYFR